MPWPEHICALAGADVRIPVNRVTRAGTRAGSPLPQQDKSQDAEIKLIDFGTSKWYKGKPMKLRVGTVCGEKKKENKFKGN